MRIIIRKVLFSIMLATTGLMFSQAVVANEGYGSTSITKIDKAKKIIEFSDVKFKYDMNTIVYDLHGKIVDFDLLQAGMTANIGYNPAKRFVGYPTIESLHLRTLIDD